MLEIGSGPTKDEDIEYYDDPSGDDVRTNQPIIVTSESGRGSGLSVILNVQPNDYPPWSSIPYYGAKILLSDPNDYPETTILYKFVSIGESLDMKVQPMVFQSDDDVRRVSPERRSCWFHDEAVLEYTDRYSHETCITECKMRNFLKYCGCVPYKYPIDATTRICEFEHLKCLNNVTAYISEEQRACYPICYMECRDKRYSITSDLTPFVSRLFPTTVIENHNVSELSALQVYYARASCNSYKLMLLMDLNYFIATYGGIFSLSFGASLLTVSELVYLFGLFLLKLLHNTGR
ncbi:sodium channel protein Nach-like [Battus philenor]|uniref:sodium channel protein Nach-like n=1 Tax=Battus philenor TaxID=42288 RepID=UPI0035D1196E